MKTMENHGKSRENWIKTMEKLDEHRDKLVKTIEHINEKPFKMKKTTEQMMKIKVWYKSMKPMKKHTSRSTMEALMKTVEK